MKPNSNIMKTRKLESHLKRNDLSLSRAQVYGEKAHEAST
jgi:hypothetical protein